MQELRNLESADNAFIEFENCRNEWRYVSWAGELQLSNEDEMIRNFLPWQRPEGRYPDRDGLFIIVAPTIPVD